MLYNTVINVHICSWNYIIYKYSISDPHLVNKLIEGKEDDIRPCVGAGYCIDRIYVGNEALCIHNASTGRESLYPHIITKNNDIKRNIIIIGGGIAGLECARICKIRGHNVSLFEANNKLGGQILLAMKGTWRKELNGIIDWRINQIEKLGVNIFLETFADYEMIINENPDIIIDASGGIPNINIIDENKGREYCNTTWDILSGNIKPKKKIIIFDYVSSHQALSCAEFIALNNENTEIELITPDRMIGEDMGNTNFPIHLRNLYNFGVKMTVDYEIEKVILNKKNDKSKYIVYIKNNYTDKIEQRYVDQIIIEYGTLPVNDLFHELKHDSINNGEIDVNELVNGKNPFLNIKKNTNGKYYLVRVGDAMVSRNIHAAVFDALRYCKDV